jgi:adenylate cyclase
MSYPEVVDSYTDFTREHLPMFLDAVNAIFRRHLVIVAFQRWSTDEEATAVTLERTVGFADLVGSTEVVLERSVAGLAEMVRRFESHIWDLVTRAGGRVVKLIGDEAMFVIEDVSHGCEVALELADSSPYPVRVGLAHGPVVGLYGDYYGAIVNLAARLVRAAEASTVVVSQSVRDGAGPGFGFQALELRLLKGFAKPVAAYRLHRSAGHQFGVQ